jgi:hypothetical protein
LVHGKNSEDFFYFLYCFSTDQSEAELLYFYSLFFSVKKPFQKTKESVWHLDLTGITQKGQTQKGKTEKGKPHKGKTQKVVAQ